MSYNIDTWKTKRIEGLVIPTSSLVLPDRLRRAGWPDPEIVPYPPGAGVNKVVINLGVEGGEAEGVLLEGELIEINDLQLWGEASGTYFYEVLIPILEKSKGVIEFVLIWERGNSITRHVFEDGAHTEENVDL